MSYYKDFDKFLKGEWYPGCPVGKSEWRKSTEADFAARGIEMESRTNVFRPIAKTPPVGQSKKRCRTKPFQKTAYNKDYMRQRRADAIKGGMCADCYHAKARKGKTTCQTCQDKRTARMLKSYYAKKAA